MKDPVRLLLATWALLLVLAGAFVWLRGAEQARGLPDLEARTPELEAQIEAVRDGSALLDREQQLAVLEAGAAGFAAVRAQWRVIQWLYRIILVAAAVQLATVLLMRRTRKARPRFTRRAAES